MARHKARGQEGRRHRQRLSCPSGKTCFRSQGVALAEVDRIRVENAQAVAPRAATPAGVYECPGCGWWHLTRSTDGAAIVKGQLPLGSMKGVTA
jgi:hypothetical protein